MALADMFDLQLPICKWTILYRKLSIKERPDGKIYTFFMRLFIAAHFERYLLDGA